LLGGPNNQTFLIALAGILLATALATISFVVIEEPIRSGHPLPFMQRIRPRSYVIDV
jgi:peptidoglycan/LPS O-acetylase OafA/YrhL